MSKKNIILIVAAFILGSALTSLKNKGPTPDVVVTMTRAPDSSQDDVSVEITNSDGQQDDGIGFDFNLELGSLLFAFDFIFADDDDDKKRKKPAKKKGQTKR